MTSDHDARAAAEAFLDLYVRRHLHAEVIIDEVHVRASDEGWTFPYNGRAWLEDRDYGRMLVGNHVVFVSRADGRAWFRSTDGTLTPGEPQEPTERPTMDPDDAQAVPYSAWLTAFQQVYAAPTAIAEVACPRCGAHQLRLVYDVDAERFDWHRPYFWCEACGYGITPPAAPPVPPGAETTPRGQDDGPEFRPVWRDDS